MRFRWEACRRHPYYLVFWSDALLYRQGATVSHPAQLLLRQAAMQMIGAIGVTGEPVDPAKSFEELGGCDLDPAFLSGAIQPMTLRSVAVMLTRLLPASERAVLGAILTTSASDEYALDGDDADRSFQKIAALCRLAQLASPAMDSYPDTPLFYVHLGASQRTIVQAVKEQVRRWKQRRGITERRVHTSKLQSYLDVWDQREGWTGSGYQRSREHSFTEIMRQSKQSLSTIANQYTSAFQMITGRKFSPSLWWRLFGPLKLSELFVDRAEILSRPIRRHQQSPVRRPVPESVVAPVLQDAPGSGMVEEGSAVTDDLTLSDLRLDLKDFFNRGLSDEEIARRFGVRDPDEFAYAQARLSEFRNIQKKAAREPL